MKLKFILSRKGFDSQFGGSPSPIFPEDAADNKNLMLSLPIPEKDSNGNVYDIGINSDDLNFRGFTFNEKYVHLDPDIRPKLYKTLPDNFIPSLGQSDSAASHLNANEVGKNDVFLFFGLFQKLEWKNERWLFTGKPFHAIWGYLQVDKRFDLSAENNCEQFKNHLHVKHPALRNPNFIYTAKKNLELNGTAFDIPGYGAFRFNELLRLTIPGCDFVTHWKKDCLPWLQEGYPNMTYHNKANLKNEYFQASYRGQEFVIKNGDPHVEWFKNLLKLRDERWD